MNVTLQPFSCNNFHSKAVGISGEVTGGVFEVELPSDRVLVILNMKWILDAIKLSLFSKVLGWWHLFTVRQNWLAYLLAFILFFQLQWKFFFWDCVQKWKYILLFLPEFLLLCLIRFAACTNVASWVVGRSRNHRQDQVHVLPPVTVLLCWWSSHAPDEY